mmetsp:Transcript_2754/g.6436  ORF Transcript_2754/g.6436 Transcript_2754/m.6436 type:complete len:431 (-) Transcript_2754:637-1929(-)
MEASSGRDAAMTTRDGAQGVSAAEALAEGDFGRVVHVLFRHGARGPSLNACKALGGGPVASSWAEEELEELTPHGLDQCEALGRFFGEALAAKGFGKDTKSEVSSDVDNEGRRVKVTWHSSPIDRTIASGKAFLKGMARAGVITDEDGEIAADNDPDASSVHYGVDSDEGGARDEEMVHKLFPEPEPVDQHDSMMLYRGFVEVPEYTEAVAKMRRGEEFGEAGKDAKNKLERVKPSLTDLFDSWAARINITTYLEEIMDCEAAREPGKPRPLTELNSPEVRRDVEELAHWCWSKRFFQVEEAKSLAAPLYAYIQSTFAAAAAAENGGSEGPSSTDEETPNKTSMDKDSFQDVVPNEGNGSVAPLHIYVHSVHDYSILLLLQQLGLSEYPDGPTLGYGGYLVLGSSGKQILNCRPFSGRDLSVSTQHSTSI